ncbi:hypothetical protein ACFFTM_03045 [Pseudoduganella plicata]|uniref:Uncharacterized protein n=1 Tax=Pseudoduganella plicata TaxID=321984 RepID=A0A4V1ATD1_9BURK|nr:hypothetical protein [Pseudoduganella plicata]QBQ35248.1 hypothetical protein E1742_02990 [Pseudoduganella plicata]GGZ04687.1 hypothetical protein GCM10007388_42830 [Pseudoduganella plicata]
MCSICACEACRRNAANVIPLRVASWNIKTLGKQFHHKEPAVIRLLAAIMLRMNAHVICLMEVMEGFGLKHTVGIVEAMKQMSVTRWRVRFPGKYTGSGGRNGLETYAVVYDADLFELTSFDLVGEEFGYAKDGAGKRQLNADSTVVTRRPAQAVFRPRSSFAHWAFYPEFRVIIFHAPSVADKDYGLACHAIGALGTLPVFAAPGNYPYTILCADLNIDEEAANHVHPREGQDFDDIVAKSSEQAARDIERYDLAYDKYTEAKKVLTAHRQTLTEAVAQRDPVAQCVQDVLDLRKWQAELAAAEKSKGKKSQPRQLAAAQQIEEIQTRLAGVDMPATGKAFLEDHDRLEQALLEATEAAFEPLENSGMFSNLSYSDDFRTTLRMSVHMACTRQPRAKHYDEELTLENFVYSNFDQVLVRAVEGAAWGDVRPGVINLLGAVMPEAVRTRLNVGTTPATATAPVPAVMSTEQWTGCWRALTAARDSCSPSSRPNSVRT